MTERTIRDEKKKIGAIWEAAKVGSARGWFAMGALWALCWMQTGKPNRPSKFAAREWGCDDPRRRKQ